MLRAMYEIKRKQKQNDKEKSKVCFDYSVGSENKKHTKKNKRK